MTPTAGITAGAVVGGVFFGYVFLSLLFFIFPNWIHKPNKKVGFDITHISHRGGAGEKLENTMAAFKYAAFDPNVRTNVIELDTQITSDGVVVVSHDSILTRCFDISDDNLSGKLISEVPYSQLPPLKKVQKLDILPGHFTRADENDPEPHIPTLEEVFQTFPTTPINLDVKVNDDELIENVHELISKYKREDITPWGNFNSVVCAKLYKRNPRIPLLFNMRSVITCGIGFWLGFLPFLPIKETMFEVPFPRTFLKLRLGKTNKWTRLIVRVLDFLLIKRLFFWHLQKRGIKVILWVLNDEAEFALAYDIYKVDGVMTDFPLRLRNFLNGRQKHTD